MLYSMSSVCIAVGVAAILSTQALAGDIPLYLQADASVYDRANDLLGRMTLEEKIAQTFAPYGGTAEKYEKEFGATSTGTVTIRACGNVGPNVSAVVACRNALQQSIIKSSRLHIPLSFTQEALHSGLSGGTVFPELVTQGTSWDVELVEEISAAIALETRAVGVDVAFSPVLNMWIDARFGRLQEGFSENPTLTAAYAKAAAVGFQGVQPAGKWDYFNATKVVALGKHYAAYGAAAGGLNGGPAELSERTLREFFLKPWKAFAKAGGKGAMTAHNTVLNQPCHANSYLVNDIFRKEFGFGDGIIISDCNDIEALISFRTAEDMPHAAAKAINGGVDWDLQCGSSSAYTSLNESLARGLVNVSVIEQAVLRSLLEKFSLGLFDSPVTDPSLVRHVNSPAHQQLALRAAEEGVVLLKNDHGVLPFNQSVKKIAVIGPNGDNPGASANMLGSYTNWDDRTVTVNTVFEALTNTYEGSGTTVTYTRGAEINQPANNDDIAKAVVAASASDVAVLVLGDDLSSSSEWGDRDNLDLPGGQMDLLTAVANTSTPCVVVLVSGRTVTFGGPDNTILDSIDGLLAAFRPGQKGGDAIANLLTGKTNPSGKLAQNWVRSAGQAHSGASPFLQWRVGKWVANTRGVHDPDGRYYDNYNDDHSSYGTMGSGQADPLFRFGQGLSYTTFALSDFSVKVAPNPTAADVPATASVKVANTGSIDGTEVVQVYVQDPVMDYVRPWKRLVAFQRVSVAAGETQTVTIPMTSDQLEFYDDDLVLRVVSGNYTFSVGGDSYAAAALTAQTLL
eukprot:m.777576 g.777576  ORF g.777576 m.777576 type:complete len:794 (+) comp23267_c1_seq1:227-2608(+)